MITACPSCHRQFDVTGYPEGAKVRCLCDAEVEVVAPTPHEPRALRCSGCGGPLSREGGQCDYCGDSVSLDELRLGEVCPECCARMADDARFCMECGVSIKPQALAACPSEHGCPRCDEPLRVRAFEDFSVVECAQCAGIWIAPTVLDDLCRSAQRRGPPPRRRTANAEVPTSPLGDVVYLSCPVCADRMVRRRIGAADGFIIDLCRNHGVWLDHGELERVMRSVAEQGDWRAVTPPSHGRTPAPVSTPTLTHAPSTRTLVGQSAASQVGMLGGIAWFATAVRDLLTDDLSPF